MIVLALAVAILAPFAQAGLAALMLRPPGLRDVVQAALAALAAGASFFLLGAAAGGRTGELVLARPLPNVELGFQLEPIGALVGALIAALGFLKAVHAGALLRAADEPGRSGALASSTLSIGAAMAAAYAANLFTMFAALLLLPLSLFALTGDRDEGRDEDAARRHAAVTLSVLFVTLLPAMVWSYALAGSLDFRAGGLLTGHVAAPQASWLLVLFVAGAGAVAPGPLMNRWGERGAFSAQMLALTHCLAAAPAAGVSVLKVTLYVFGGALGEAGLGADALLAGAGAGACVAALAALSKQDLHERIAYSLLAQTLLVGVGALLASPAGVFGAALQLLAASGAGATMVMTTGAVMAATNRRTAAAFAGLGKLMPWVLAAFAIAAATMVGMPPFAGAWAKLFLISAGFHAHQVWLAVAAGLMAVLTFAHLGPLAAHALAGKAPAHAFTRPDGAPLLLVAPAALGAAATLSLIFLANPLFAFLAQLWTAPS